MIQLAPQTVNVSITCRVCSSNHLVPVNRCDFDAWQEGELIQKAFPYLSADERELLKSRTCGVCWDAMFSEDEVDF